MFSQLLPAFFYCLLTIHKINKLLDSVFFFRGGGGGGGDYPRSILCENKRVILKSRIKLKLAVCWLLVNQLFTNSQPSDRFMGELFFDFS